MDIGTITVAGMGAVPLVIGIVQSLKNAGLPTKYAPLLAVIAGIALVGLVQGATVDAVMTGLVVGLSASGLWSGTKTILE